MSPPADTASCTAAANPLLPLQVALEVHYKVNVQTVGFFGRLLSPLEACRAAICYTHFDSMQHRLIWGSALHDGAEQICA